MPVILDQIEAFAAYTSGNPEGNVVANAGTLYVASDGSGVFYKASGSGNTGWVQLAQSGVTAPLSASGSPEGNTSASPGTMYVNTDTNDLYIKATGTGTTGWYIAAGPNAGGGGVVAPLTGTSSPEGVTTANPGATFVNTSNNDVYFKATGTGNIGWILISGGTVSVSFYSGAGSPEGSQAGDVGDYYWDTTNNVIYHKETGTGNTGWVAHATGTILYSGTGSPEGNQTSTVGNLYWDTTNNLLYYKATGTGNTGWVAHATGGSVTVSSGAGSPESSVTGSVNDLYFDTATDLIYFKETGTGNTGWVQINFRVYNGSGSPEGVVTATIGSLYFNTAGNHLWFKETGTGNTGWVEIYWNTQQVYSGTSSPEGVIVANTNDLYFDTVAALLYFKTTDGVNTGWVVHATGGSVTVSSGAGSPESSVTGNVNDIYFDTTGDILYFKETGTGNTGWKAIITFSSNTSNQLTDPGPANTVTISYVHSSGITTYYMNSFSSASIGVDVTGMNNNKGVWIELQGSGTGYSINPASVQVNSGAIPVDFDQGFNWSNDWGGDGDRYVMVIEVANGRATVLVFPKGTAVT